MNEEIPYNPPGMDEYIREGARKNSELLRRMSGQPATPETGGTKAVAVQRVVSRPHPWKTQFGAQKKLKEARRQAALRRMKRYRDDGKEYFRLTEASWHKAHPNGANTGNPKFTVRAIKANAAKSANGPDQRPGAEEEGTQ